MKTKRPTELSNTLFSNDDMLADTVAKQLFAINDVIAWLLKACIPEYAQMEPADIISQQLAKADIRLGTEPVAQDVRPRVPIVGTEDNSVTDGLVMYDLRTELPLPNAPPKAPLLILDVEMQKDYDSWLLFYKRMIYYICRLVSSQPGRLMSGEVDYSRLCRVCSIWVLPNAPQHLANHVRHLSFNLEDITGGHPADVEPPCRFADAWIFHLRDGFPPPRQRDIFWLLYVLLTRTMSYEKKLEILEEDFSINTTKEVEQMYGYTQFLWNQAEKNGEKRGEKKGMNKALLKAYANMKDANCSDGYIRSMLGISARKLQEIKKLFEEIITDAERPLA